MCGCVPGSGGMDYTGDCVGPEPSPGQGRRGRISDAKNGDIQSAGEKRERNREKMRDHAAANHVVFYLCIQQS